MAKAKQSAMQGHANGQGNSAAVKALETQLVPGQVAQNAAQLAAVNAQTAREKAEKAAIDKASK